MRVLNTTGAARPFAKAAVANAVSKISPSTNKPLDREQPDGTLPPLTFVCDGVAFLAPCIALAEAYSIPYSIIWPTELQMRTMLKQAPRHFAELELEVAFAGKLIIACRL
jgi:hypothetical protein